MKRRFTQKQAEAYKTKAEADAIRLKAFLPYTVVAVFGVLFVLTMILHWNTSGLSLLPGILKVNASK